MSYSGYLIKLGGNNGTELPLTMVKAESYQVTPNQRMESSAKRDTTGKLHRTTCSHTASKVEIDTIPMTNSQWQNFFGLVKAKYSDSHSRTIELKYYDPESDSYKTGTFYVPDLHYPILRIDGNIIYYDSISLHFIEY